jgi:hypothetical protein
VQRDPAGSGRDGDRFGPFWIVRVAAGERGKREKRRGRRFILGGLRRVAHRGEQLACGWRDQFDVVVGAEHDEPWSRMVTWDASRVEA